MNFNKILTMVFVLLFVAFVGNTTAQTFYVNNSSGNDANSGTAPDQAKATVFSALIAAPGGSTISVAGTGINYIEAAPVVRGTYTFISTGTTPVFVNALNVGDPGVAGWVGGGITDITAGPNSVVTTAVANGIKNGDLVYIDGTANTNYDKKYFTASAVAPLINKFTINNTAGPALSPPPATAEVAARGDVTFQGPFEFDGGLNLNVGTLTNGNQLTVKTQVYRTDLGSIANGGLVYSGDVSLVYDNQHTAAPVSPPFVLTTGLEWPPGATANNLNTQNTSGGGITLKLNNASTMKGVLTTVGPFNLNTYQLTINGANAHTIGGNTTNGTLDFVMTGAASIGGAFGLPNVIADRSSGSAALTINATITGTLNLTANSSATLTANVNGNSGNILSNGSGLIQWIGQTATSTVGSVTAATTSTADIQLSNLAANPITTGAITQSGTGKIWFPTNVNAVTVGSSTTSANVLLNTAIPAFVNAASGSGAVADKAIIAFPDAPVTIWGSVTNSAVFSGSSDQLNNTGNGLITFGSTTTVVTIKGTLTCNVSGSYALTGSGTGTNNGLVTFASTNPPVPPANLLVLAGVTNSSTLAYSSTPATVAASIIANAGGTGGVAFTAMTNSSTYAGADIDFSLMSGAISGTSMTQSGTVKGGQIKLGNGTTIAFSGDITSTRLVTGSDITIGTAASVASLGGKYIINHGASNIVINSVSGAGTVSLSGITCDGTGTISFPNATGAGAFSLGPFSVSSGTVSFGSGTGAINITGVVQLTNGTVDFGSNVAGRAVTMNNASIQLGGVGTKVTFANSQYCQLIFAQPIPNVNQVITLGTLDETWPGWVDVANVALLPAPYVLFRSAAGSTGSPGNLYILNTGGVVPAIGLRFDTGNPLVLQTVQLDNARLYVGRNTTVIAYGGDFQNTSGYTTISGGFVMMSGGTANLQRVNPSPASTGATFGNFGVDNSSGLTPSVSFSNTATMMGDFYMAQGAVAPANLDFTAAAPYSTIFRTEGTFTAVLPDPTSKVNVTYYGGDKTTSNEIPAGTSKLWNLTVATTNGAKPGFGIITMSGPLTVNGTLTINTNQALYTGTAHVLTMLGASAVIYGYLVDDGDPEFILGAATGTTITGAGFLPTIQVANSSLNNSVAGITGLYSRGFGADGAWGGGDDDFTTADGNIFYVSGTGDTGSSLTVGFTGAGPHFDGLTIGVAPLPTAGVETFKLSTNAVMSGNITQDGGIIDLGGFTLTHKGTTFHTDGTPASGTEIQNGTLAFVTTATNLNVVGAVDTIKANVTFNAPGGTIVLPALASPPYPLVITGNVTLSDDAAGATGTTVDIGAGNSLTLGGSSVTVSAHSAFTATTGGTTGVLDLTNIAPSTLLTFTVPASASVANLTIDGNVTLAGGITGSTLTVTNFVHNSGLFTFGSANLQIGNATAATFTRNGGTYAGDGWLIWNSTTALGAGFKHSAVAAAGAMTINNFRLNQPLTLQNAVNLNIVKGLYLYGASLTNQVGGTGGGYVFMGDASNVPMIRVVLPNDVTANALQFTNANADFTFNGPSGYTVSTRVWPASATLARDVLVDMDNYSYTLILAANRTITRNLTLDTGVLTWDSPTVISMATGATITRWDAGALNKDQNADGTAGTFTAPNVNLVYLGNVGNSGIEYSDPVVVNNLTLGSTTISGYASYVTLNSARTVAGTVAIINCSTCGVNSIMTIAKNTTFSAPQNITVGEIEVDLPYVLTLSAACTMPELDGNITAMAAFTLLGSHDNGTITASSDVTVGPAGSFDPTSNLVFVGTSNATLTVPATGTLAGNVTLNKTGNTPVPKVTLAGGNLTVVAPAQINFINGLFVTGSNTLILPTVVQGFTRAVATGNYSHVVGNVSKVPGNGFVGRLEYPLGTIQSVRTAARYRPVAITFLLSDPLLQGGAITFTHVDSTPGGNLELSANGGKGIDAGLDAHGRRIWINTTASFYWLGSSQYGLGPSQTFDLELTGEGFNSYSDTSLVAVNRLRIIRRFDGNTDNPWMLQGGTNYASFLFADAVNPALTWPIVRVIGSSGGIEPQASRFTYGYDGLGITGVGPEPGGIPTVYNLSQNYPNPFNPTTQIKFDLPKQSQVRLEIYDMLGQKVRTLIAGDMMDPGYYNVTWNGTNENGNSVASGVYYYRIVADKFTSLKKMMFLK
jgi:fibronectin-binding autotransporter adhesin